LNSPRKNPSDLKRFKRVYLEISNICNLKCSFCPEVKRAQWRLEKDRFVHRLTQVKDFAERVCLHVMGEPLGHPLFREFVESAGELGVPLEITTNGTLLNESIKQALLHPTIVQVNFSLQSFFDNFPKADADTYVNKIFEFCQTAFEKRPDLYVNLRLWNLKDQRDVSGRNAWLFEKLQERFSVALNPSVDPGFKKSKKVTGRLYLHFDSRFEWPSLEQPLLSESGRCHGGQNQIAVLSEGNVVPCCLDKEAVMDLGNLDQVPFMDILQSPRLKNLVEGFQKGERREELCRRCDYATRF